MPITAVCCMIGAAAISAVPLFSGFVSKGMILAAAASEHHTIVFIVLLFASAGVVDHSGIKVPFFAFFAHDSGIRCGEAPKNMLAAMIICAVLCIGLALPGIYPYFYKLLPFAGVEFHPYTTAHVITQLQVLFFAALAFIVLMKKGLYPDEIPAVNLDFDWFYRKPLPAFARRALATTFMVKDEFERLAVNVGKHFLEGLFRLLGPASHIARSQGTSSMVFWVAVMLLLVLCFYYV